MKIKTMKLIAWAGVFAVIAVFAFIGNQEHKKEIVADRSGKGLLAMRASAVAGAGCIQTGYEYRPVKTKKEITKCETKKYGNKSSQKCWTEYKTKTRYHEKAFTYRCGEDYVKVVCKSDFDIWSDGFSVCKKIEKSLTPSPE